MSLTAVLIGKNGEHYISSGASCTGCWNGGYSKFPLKEIHVVNAYGQHAGRRWPDTDFRAAASSHVFQYDGQEATCELLMLDYLYLVRRAHINGVDFSTRRKVALQIIDKPHTGAHMQSLTYGLPCQRDTANTQFGPLAWALIMESFDKARMLLPKIRWHQQDMPYAGFAVGYLLTTAANVLGITTAELLEGAKNERFVLNPGTVREVAAMIESGGEDAFKKYLGVSDYRHASYARMLGKTTW